MAYITQADLVPKRVPELDAIELTDDAKTGEIDAAVITDVINRASAFVDQHAGVRYTLPLSSTQQVKDLAMTLAKFYLYDRRNRVPQSLLDEYRNAKKFLEAVRDNQQNLDEATLKQASGMQVATKDHSVAEQQDVFDNEKLKDF